MHLRTRLLERIERARPRVIRVIADAGWGKSAFVQALTARTPSAVVVEARDADGGDGFEGLALEALAAFGDAASVGTLRELWAAAGVRLFAVEDVHLLEDDGVDVVRMLLRALPPQCTIILTSRAPLPFELSRYFAPHQIFTVGPEDLALTDEEQRAVLGGADLDERTLQRALQISHGWPIATYLFGRLAREGRLAALLDRLEDRAFDDLHAYVDNEILAAIGADDLDVLLLCTCAGAIRADDLIAVLGDAAQARFSRLSAQRVYVSSEEGRCRALPVVAASLQRSRPDAVSAMAERCAAARDERGDHNGAAVMWLANGNPQRAAASLDRLGPPPAGAPISGRHLRLLLRIPLDALLRSRYALVALLTSPHVCGTPYALVAEASAICDRLAGDGDADAAFRVSARLALAVASMFASRPRLADDILDLVEEERRNAPLTPEREELFIATRACVWSMRGRVADAAALWASLQLEDVDGRTVFETHRIELRLALALAAGEHAQILPLLGGFVALARDAGDPVAIAHARVLEAAFQRAAGARANAEMIVTEVEREELADTDPDAYGHIVRAGDLPPERRSRLSCMYLADMAYEQNDPLTARRMLEAAVAGSDRIGGTHMQIATRMLLAFIPGSSRARLFEEARRIAMEVQHPNTLASVEALVAGRYAEAVSFSFVARRVEIARFAIPVQALRVEILRARVTRGVTALPMRTREFEVLAALALAHVPVPRAALVSRLWGEDAADEAAPALRTAIHRLRKQVGDPNAVIFENGAYRLGPFVTVDVHDIEAALAGFRRLKTLTDRERERLLDISVALAVDPPELYDDWDWMAPHLANVLELRHRAAILLGEEALAGGSPDDAVAVADTVLRLDPFDEPLVELAVRALLAAGRRAEAVRRARRYVDDLARELGGDPASQLLRTLSAGETHRAAVG
jgi:DNA-binding SARP family transcriptional activator